MMKFATPLLLIVLSFSACKPAMQETEYAKLEWKDDVYSLNGALFTGIARDHHKNGRLKGEYPFRDGRFHGVVREWWDNGQLSTETHFENGQRHGSNKYWTKAGELMKEQIYDHDQSVSVKHFPAK